MKHLLFAFIPTALLLVALCWVRNPAFEFCTARAYGLPLPWRIDLCSCAIQTGNKQVQTVYPRLPWCLSFGMVMVLSIGLKIREFQGRSEQ